MDTPQEVKELFGRYTDELNEHLRALFSKRNDLALYGHMAYFMGFANEELKPEQIYGGKRYRSALLLMLADMYGAKDASYKAAIAFELFHNFTLIHDDIVDRDFVRRGRPTVWKLFGNDHAINSGDGQFILAMQYLTQGSRELPKGDELISHTLACWLQVIEGQYLDFSLTDMSLDDSRVTEEAYEEMTSKKTSVLVAGATKAAGIVANTSYEEMEHLWNYGLHLGLAYQLCDDCMSIWGDEGVTGKRAYGDIKEKKKTLPIIYTRNTLDAKNRDRLCELYSSEEPLSDEQAHKVIDLLESVDTRTYTRQKIEEHKQLAQGAVDALSLNNAHKETLRAVIDALLPNVAPSA